MKDTFLRSEFWMLSVQGAFQRASIYKNRRYILKEEKLRTVFRKNLKEFVDNQLIYLYKVGVTEENHFLNIRGLIEHSEKVGSELLIGNKLSFGIAQKLLNLYLKYQWTAGWIARPVHFPFDSRIQEFLEMKEESRPWTKMKDSEQYKKVIYWAQHIVDKRRSLKKCDIPIEIMHLADLELYLFRREGF